MVRHVGRCAALGTLGGMTTQTTKLRTLDDLGDIRGLRVLLRVDFNVPLADGLVGDDTRIRQALPTIEALRERGARLLLVSHLGRPKGHDPELSLAPVAERLATMLDAPVDLAPDLDHVPDGDLVMLENIRFEPGETANDPELAARLAALADAYVNDAFGSAHRAHASTEGVVHHLERSAAGLLLEREVATFTAILRAPERPLVAILGGAKVTDKIGVIERFLEIADAVLIGGAMSYPFIAARGEPVGDSLCEPEGIPVARDLLDQVVPQGKLHLPIDIVVGDAFSPDAAMRVQDFGSIEDGWEGMDAGPRTRAAYTELIEGARTVFWNGPVGAFELAPFSAGTRAIAEAVANTSATTVVGGGDSIAALRQFGLEDRVTHQSTGGGAALELIEGRALPGLVALTS
jgi:phosphoglycerate kinase